MGTACLAKNNVVINIPALHTSRVNFFFLTRSDLFYLGRVVLRMVGATLSQAERRMQPLERG